MKKCLSLLLCTMLLALSVSAWAETFTPGTYTGTGDGQNGPVTVEVTLSETEITGIRVTEHQETQGLSDPAIEQIPEQIVAGQTLNVDTVSGATVTSNAILSAVTEALTQAGADVEALKAKPAAIDEAVPEDMHTQVVVVGGGMAGLLAATSAADAGAEVVLVEKLASLGGSVSVASGTLLTVESEYTQDVDDSIERPLSYFHLLNDGAEHQPDYDFLRSVLERNGETIDFMTGTLGLTGSVSDANFAKVSFEGRGAGLVEGLEEAAVAQNVTVLKNTKAESILMEDGKATGITVSVKGGMYTIFADKVIICAGGASRDEERMNRYIPELATMDLYEKASVGNTGDGFNMLEAAGADMVQDLFVKASAPEFADVFGFTISSKPGVTDQLLVDAQGERFTNEAPNNSMMLTTEMFKHPSSAYYVIYDAVHITEELKAAFDAQIAAEDPKVVVYAKTPEELAQKMGADPETFVATFEAYQAACEAGVDEAQGKSADHLIAFDVSEGLYAAYQMPSSYGTIGGCVTDLDGHVLDAQGEIIPNLFAAGECSTFKLFGDYYVGGGSLGLYATTGRIAGLTAVQELTAGAGVQ